MAEHLKGWMRRLPLLLSLLFGAWQTGHAVELDVATEPSVAQAGHWLEYLVDVDGQLTAEQVARSSARNWQPAPGARRQPQLRLHHPGLLVPSAAGQQQRPGADAPAGHRVPGAGPD